MLPSESRRDSKSFLFALLAFALAACSPTPAPLTNRSDGDLRALIRSLAAVRTTHGVNQERGAGPELAAVKRRLREYVEKKILFLPQKTDLVPVQAVINTELERAGLTCGQDPNKKCTEKMASGGTQDNARGYVGAILLAYDGFGRYLIVRTSVGVRCGFDESAYIYERLGGDWRLLLESEQDKYGADAYAPQALLLTRISEENVSPEVLPSAPLILTLGYSPWCGSIRSNWQTLYARLWRASRSNPAPVPLLDTRDEVFIGDDPAIAEGSVTGNEVLFEFVGRSIGSDVSVRPHVRHFGVRNGDKVERLAPVAISPRDFVDEWLTRPWSESSQWTQSANLEKSYRQLGGGDLAFGKFHGAAKRCRRDPTLWEVGFSTLDKSYGLKPPVYFLVRWDAPYRFVLMDVRTSPVGGCHIADSMPDSFGTLFPLRYWRR